MFILYALCLLLGWILGHMVAKRSYDAKLRGLEEASRKRASEDKLRRYLETLERGRSTVVQFPKRG